MPYLPILILAVILVLVILYLLLWRPRGNRSCGCCPGPASETWAIDPGAVPIEPSEPVPDPVPPAPPPQSEEIAQWEAPVDDPSAQPVDALADETAPAGETPETLADETPEAPADGEIEDPET